MNLFSVNRLSSVLVHAILPILLMCGHCFDWIDLGGRTSLELEQHAIHKFFTHNQLPLRVENTKNVRNCRIFLHDFTASEIQINKIISILKLEKVSKKDFLEIHSGDLARDIDIIYSPIGEKYLKDPDVWFFKSDEGNKKAQSEISATRVFLFYNTKSKKACFQTFYGWG